MLVLAAAAVAGLWLLAGAAERWSDWREGKAVAANAGRLDRSVTPLEYEVKLKILPDKPVFWGNAAIKVRLDAPKRAIWLHARDLSIKKAKAVKADGRYVLGRLEQKDAMGLARLSFGETLPPGELTLYFAYEAPFAEDGQGLYKVAEDGETYVFSQLQPIAARRVFPAFDQPEFKTPYQVTVLAEPGQTVIGNAPLEAVEPYRGGLKAWRFKPTAPLPSYLLAFAVGPFDIFDAGAIPTGPDRTEPVPLRGIAVKGQAYRLASLMERTRALVPAFERYFARPYPFAKLDILAAPDLVAAAMENAGAVMVRDSFVTGAADNPARIHWLAHSLSHQWLGNLVTPNWWDDLWLNESFGTWLGDKFSGVRGDHAGLRAPAAPRDRAAARRMAFAMNADESAAAQTLQQEIASSHDILTAFEPLIYQKGRAVLDMYERFLGPDRFRDALRLHVDRFAHATADTNDLMASLMAATGRGDVAASFATFIHQPGVPALSAELSCAGAPVLKLRQERYRPLGSRAEPGGLWMVPVCVAYGGAGGVPARSTQCAMMQERTAEVPLQTEACPAWLAPNAEGRGYYFTLVSAEMQARLIDHLAALSQQEALLFVDSQMAAFHAGRLSAERLMATLKAVAGSDHWPALLQAGLALRALGDSLDDADMRRRYDAMLRGLFRRPLDDSAAGLAQVAAQDGLSAASWRTAPRPPRAAGADDEADAELTAFLVIHAEDAAASAAVAGIGEAILNTGAPAGLPSMLKVTALVAAARQGGGHDGESGLKRLERHFHAAEDANLRRGALTALALVGTRPASERVRALALDARLSIIERAALLRTFMHSRAFRRDAQANWDWLRLHGAALKSKLPVFERGLVIRLAGGFCSAERAEEVEDYFADRAAAIEGGPRALVHTVEAIERCAALRTATAGDLTRYLRRLHTAGAQ